MGNYNTRAITFRQSLKDFPLTVSLGRNNPTWGINRWRDNNGLRFAPLDDECFNIRGDKNKLLYKGRKRSHRFTILNDGAFEYDCILNREPDSNVITIKMIGAEYYDFFRQPDFVSDPFLKGSYAVYLKETLVGQGTGKLCHIHRPMIIDALGRKCWGDLTVVGNELRITIDEQWLGNAKYPVTVDPTIGTTTVGSLTYPEGNPIKTSCLVYEIGVNKFLAPEKISGLCTAWTYFSNVNNAYNHYYPRIFIDNNNKPSIRKSINEGYAMWNIWYDNDYKNKLPTPNTPKWKSCSFEVIDNINEGSYIWFGGYGSVLYPHFDYGSVFYKNWPEFIYTREPEGLIYDEEEDEWYEDEGDCYESPDFPINGEETIYNYKISWYFEYTSTRKNYVMTLTHGINITDTKKIKADYNRINSQTNRITDTRKLNVTYKRYTSNNVNAKTFLNLLLSFFRNCVMSINNNTYLSKSFFSKRFVINELKTNDFVKNNRNVKRKCDDFSCSYDETDRIRGFIGKIFDSITEIDDVSNSVFFVRTVNDKQILTDILGNVKDFFRGLYDEAKNATLTDKHNNFFRTERDKIYSFDIASRSFFIFIKILTVSFIRDFIIKRFLIAREELVLKSCITREITLDSKIN